MLRITKIVWVIFVAIDLILYVFGGIVYYRQLDQVCVGTRLECHDREFVTSEDVARLQQDGISLRDWAIANIAYRTLITLIYCAVAFLIFMRKRNGWNGLLISYFLIAFGSIGGNYPALIANYPALTLPVNIIGYLAYVSFALFFAAFPNGRVVPRAMWVPIAIWSFSFFLSQFFDWPPRTASGTYAYAYAAVLWIGMFISGMLAQLYRYFRMSNIEERRQTKWVLFGIVILVISIVTLYFSPWSNLFGDAVVYSRTSLTLLIVFNLLITLIPITIGIAILRNRLFDIDVIIRRTLTYVLVSALLALVFFGCIVLLEQILANLTGTNGSELVTVLSTLAIAALFVPLRNRVQAEIDRRFNRNKYDAQRILSDFANTVRDETDLEKLTARLLQVVDETMQPESVSMWLKPSWEQRKTAEGRGRKQ